MEKFESSVKVIPYSQKSVYNKLSDLNNLKNIEDKLPKDKIKSITLDSDNVTFEVDNIGKLSLSVVDREPDKTIKFGSSNSPIQFNLWIQLLPVSETSSKMKLTVKMDLNIFMRGMLKKPIEDGLEKISVVLSQIRYD